MKALFSQTALFFQGIATTKLLAVLVFALSANSIVRVYYFRMYTFFLILGIFNGLVFMPILLSCFGPSSIKLKL